MQNRKYHIQVPYVCAPVVCKPFRPDSGALGRHRRGCASRMSPAALLPPPSYLTCPDVDAGHRMAYNEWNFGGPSVGASDDSVATPLLPVLCVHGLTRNASDFGYAFVECVTKPPSGSSFRI
jgi:hypothetical protein